MVVLISPIPLFGGVQVMCDKEMVKIRQKGRNAFFEFETDSEAQAATLTDCLVIASKKASEASS